jgi:hypothetical protein
MKPRIFTLGQFAVQARTIKRARNAFIAKGFSRQAVRNVKELRVFNGHSYQTFDGSIIP